MLLLDSIGFVTVPQAVLYSSTIQYLKDDGTYRMQERGKRRGGGGSVVVSSALLVQPRPSRILSWSSPCYGGVVVTLVVLGRSATVGVVGDVVGGGVGGGVEGGVGSNL